MALVSLQKDPERIKVEGFEFEDPVIFKFLEKRSAADKDALLIQALKIGMHALREERISSFLARTESELGLELEYLKQRLDAEAKVQKTASKGDLGEIAVKNSLEELSAARKWGDRPTLTGNDDGSLGETINKTGDILIEVTGALKPIAVEVKLNSSLTVGGISEKDIFGTDADHAWGQLLESTANRDAAISIIVFDRSSVSSGVNTKVGDIVYLPEVGIAVVIDMERDDYRALHVAYSLARSVALAARPLDQVSVDQMLLLAQRAVKELGRAGSIRKMVVDQLKDQAKRSKKLLEEVDKSLIALEAVQKYFEAILANGKLSTAELYAMYIGDSENEQFAEAARELAKEVDAIAKLK